MGLHACPDAHMAAAISFPFSNPIVSDIQCPGTTHFRALDRWIRSMEGSEELKVAMRLHDFSLWTASSPVRPTPVSICRLFARSAWLSPYSTLSVSHFHFCASDFPLSTSMASLTTNPQVLAPSLFYQLQYRKVYHARTQEVYPGRRCEYSTLSGYSSTPPDFHTSTPTNS